MVRFGGGASPQASSSAHITLPNCHCPLHRSPLSSPALPPSILDRMINGVSGHASATVPEYPKHYHNFFFFFAVITETVKSPVTSMKHRKLMFLPEAL